MTASQAPLVLQAHAPALVGDDSRPVAVVCAMERGLPGLRLAWTISDVGKLVAVPPGEEVQTDGGFALYCNGDDEHLVTITGREVPGALCPGGNPELFVYAQWPTDAVGIAAAVDVLEGVAEGARSYWAHVTPNSVLKDIAEQTSRGPASPPKSPRGLPMLKEPWEIRSPSIPDHLGWLNYWSAAAAQAIGFPAPASDGDLLSRARRTEAGGWVVQLTDKPLDLDNAAHLQALLRAYERFPVIGGRAPA